ncbi:MAG: conjugative transposon protein TraM [Paludibacteraceae bacterium]|nr:conjugative transposon protein TraM [Paludibacteraceae bacterium]
MVEQKSNIDKQRNLLQVGGVFVFLTVVALFFILGGGSGDESLEVADDSPTGLNTSLPDPDDVYASEGKFEAVRKEQSRISMEKNQHLAQNSSFDMLNSLNAPREEKTKQVDVDDLLSKIEDDEPVSQLEESAPIKEEPRASGKTSPSVKKTGTLSKEDSLNALIRKARREDALRRVRNGLGSHADSALLGLNRAPASKPAVRPAEEKSTVNVSQGRKGFKTENAKSMGGGDKATIQAVIHGEQKGVRSSSQVFIRLLEPVTIKGTTIPASTNLIGSVVFSENRVMITTESIKFNGDLYPFRGTIYDQDGMKGLYTGENLANDMAKEGGQSAISGTDQHVSGGYNMVTKVTNTLIDGTKSVLEKTQRKKSVDLPANYKIFIKLE